VAVTPDMNTVTLGVNGPLWFTGDILGNLVLKQNNAK